MQLSSYTTLRFDVENAAKKMGMEYPTEQKVLDDNMEGDREND